LKKSRWAVVSPRRWRQKRKELMVAMRVPFASVYIYVRSIYARRIEVKGPTPSGARSASNPG
jgi:hypothetical protein